MDSRYQPDKIEPKWQGVWDAKDLFTAKRDPKREKFYYLDMFAYPSGDMHMGHVRNYTIGDVVCRKKTMQGRNVLHPVGFDSFGLPAEQAAIARGLHPADWTKQCIDNMRRQLKMLGVTYDWSRELATSAPSYYKWTQWVFLKLFDAGLAERKKAPVNWCPSCETVLANEQVIQGECERCHAQVTKKNLEQWFFKTTRYAQRNLDDMALLEGKWPPAVLTLERNWIGRSEGAEIDFELVDPPEGVDPKMSVFTTRPDTLFGVTYMVIAPEHPLVDRVTKPEHSDQVKEFVGKQRLRTEIDRTSDEAEKEGVPTGAMVRNPINGEEVPLWVADYVLLEYGTGIVMAVPGHDQRDYDFARKYGLPIRTVIRPADATDDYDATKEGEAYIAPGVQVNSGAFDGMPNEEGKVAITGALSKMGEGRPQVTYRLRDWCVSRQRYWGAPIPVVYCDKCGPQPVPESELPVLLPTDVTFTGKGGNPIATSPTFMKTNCPKCGGPATRETDTMDTFVCSAWYYLRYPCAFDEEHAWNADDIAYWMPIDLYIGGIEHAIGHLLFSRFVTKAFCDMGLLPFKEFATRHFNHGVVTWEKKRMSKRGGHLIAPEETIQRYGADALRCYILFIAPAEAPAEWTGTGIGGQVRFLSRVHRFCATYCERFDPDWQTKIGSESLTERDLAIRRKVHQTTKKISEDIEALKFNTSIAALMELTNELYAYAPVEGEVDDVNAIVLSEALEKMTLILSPFAPHLADEMWEALGRSPTCLETAWPGYDPEIAKVEEITIPISVDGKVRDKVVVPADISEAELQEMALARENVQKYLGESGPKRVVVVPGRIVNIVP